MESYSALKERKSHIRDNMNAPGGIFDKCEMSHAQIDKFCMVLSICGI